VDQTWRLNNYASPHRIKGNGFNSQARKLILNVLDFFQKSGNNPDLLKPSPLDIASKGLNISPRSFSNVKKKSNKEGKLETPKRKNKIIKKRKHDLFDTFDIQAIKNIVSSFYSEQ